MRPRLTYPERLRLVASAGLEGEAEQVPARRGPPMREESESELVHIGPPAGDQVECSLGITDGHIEFRLRAGRPITLRLNADQADQLAADLRMYALELRNGGPLT